jgi:hypothetical protein
MLYETLCLVRYAQRTLQPAYSRPLVEPRRQSFLRGLTLKENNVDLSFYDRL